VFPQARSFGSIETELMNFAVIVARAGTAISVRRNNEYVLRSYEDGLPTNPQDPETGGNDANSIASIDALCKMVVHMVTADAVIPVKRKR
jgi:hypothetical protein